jgi:hypothetical protein
MSTEITALTTAVQALRTQLGTLQTAHDKLEERADNALIPLEQRERMVYENAAHWLRMVNTITWTLTSIFLVVAIVALNNAQGAAPEWKHTIGYTIFGLCWVWFAVDLIYGISSLKARWILEDMEKTKGWTPSWKLYTWQRAPNARYALWLVMAAAMYSPIAGVSWLSLTKFAWAP